MSERDARDQEFGDHHGPHPHRHHAGRRFRARFGPPDFDRGTGEPGGARTRARAGVGPDFGPAFYGALHAGQGGFGPRGRYGRRAGRAKRGDVRAAALALLAEEPMNGYQIIQQISERSGGLWRPSPGSVYPALAQLEDENLVVLRATAGERRSYALTDAGREYVAEHADELKAPWSAVSGDAASAAADLHALVRQVHVAAFGVLNAGTEAQMAMARKILAQTRRSLYRILAEDDEAGGQAGQSAGQ